MPEGAQFLPEAGGWRAFSLWMEKKMGKRGLQRLASAMGKSRWKVTSWFGRAIVGVMELQQSSDTILPQKGSCRIGVEEMQEIQWTAQIVFAIHRRISQSIEHWPGDAPSHCNHVYVTWFISKCTCYNLSTYEWVTKMKTGKIPESICMWIKQARIIW